MLPSADILLEFEHGKFVLSNLAAKRAKQIKDGAPPLVQIESNHPLTIALAEIAAGKIKPVVSAEVAAVEGPDITLLPEEPLPAELGMLLPALDEVEAGLIAPVAIVEDEIEHDVEHDDADVDGLSLSDLAGDEEEVEEEEPAAAADEDETLSLSDIEEQESADEDEAETED